MSGKAGVWIDHRNAVIVALGDGTEHTTRIASHAEKHLERGGDRPMKGRAEHLSVPADDARQRAHTGELNVYYDAVIAALRDYDRLLILGPGEAKGELHKRLEKAKLHTKVDAVQSADQMTDPQLAAMVRAHFGASAPRFQPRE